MGFVTQSFHSLEEFSQRLLMPITKILQGLIEHVLRVILVDGIVREMHAEIVHIVLGGVLILLGRETHESLVVYVNPQRVTSGHQRVDAQIELETFVQQWVGYVFLHNAVLVLEDL